ncbi:MAG: sigma-70 family RNA polymerase sigma factor [Planctomycetota bacterium]
MASTTSPSLLLRIRNPEDQDAWDEFLEIYTPVVRTYCFQRRLQDADISDIVQDVMSRIVKLIRDFDYDPAKGKFRAWFGTITANRIKTFVTRKSRNQKALGQTEASAPVETYTDPDSDWVAIFSDQVYQAACSRVRPVLEDTTWECFEATWLRNVPAADVAKALGIPVHSVYVNKSRVLKRLENEVRILAEDLPFHNDSQQI